MSARLKLSHDPSTLCLTNLISLSSIFSPQYSGVGFPPPTRHRQATNTTRKQFQFSSSSKRFSLVPSIVRDGQTINSNYPSVIGAIGSRLGELVEPNITAQFNEECTYLWSPGTTSPESSRCPGLAVDTIGSRSSVSKTSFCHQPFLCQRHIMTTMAA